MTSKRTIGASMLSGALLSVVVFLASVARADPPGPNDHPPGTSPGEILPQEWGEAPIPKSLALGLGVVQTVIVVGALILATFPPKPRRYEGDASTRPPE